jgi:MoaA/NifB/PqqE/SkfB family radical SAM enzyme
VLPQARRAFAAQGANMGRFSLMKSDAKNPFAIGAFLRALPRAFDALPIWAQINITWKCNLSCSYCTEFDNSKGHVPFAEAVSRIDKCKELGVAHTDLIGGEPLLHPDLLPLMRHVRKRGMTTGMTTNGFLLTQEKLEALLDAGMGRIQISVDSLHPTAGSPKSLKTLRSRIEMVAKRGLWFYVAAVICDETLHEVQALAEFCFELGVPIFFAVIHDRGRLRLGPSTDRYLEKVRWVKQQKLEGRPVSNPYYLIEYYERALSGRPLPWRCQGGHKAFYVSPEGNFHYCYHTDPVAPFADVTRAQTKANRAAKGCENGCGVDCMVNTSLPFSRMSWVFRTEIVERLRGLPRLFLPSGRRRTIGSLDSSSPGTQEPK